MWSGNNPSVINPKTFLLIFKNVNISIDLTMINNVNTLTQSVPAVAIQQITNWQPRSPYYILLTDESLHHDGGDNIIYLLCQISNFKPKILYGPQINKKKVTKLILMWNIYNSSQDFVILEQYRIK